MRNSTDKNLILIGMMGVGKTIAGKECSRIMKKEFYDTDEIYEKRFGSITNTFSKEGERVFRKRESEILEELAGLMNAVIATGGGAVLSDKFGVLKNTGTVIWLCASPVILSKRLEANDMSRPLNKGTESLNKILLSRENLYKKNADIIINTDNLSVPDVITNCLKAFEV